MIEVDGLVFAYPGARDPAVNDLAFAVVGAEAPRLFSRHGSEGVADHQLLYPECPSLSHHARHALTDELVIDVAMNEPTRGVAANLAGVECDRRDQFFSGIGNVDVIKHDGGALTAQFQLDRHEVATA